MKLLSIVTPTYNRAPYLQRCFSSLAAQTDRRFEWIIVDDGSTDDTPETAKSIRKLAPEMEIFYLRKEHGGKHTAMNAAHPLIHGDYVLVLDDDDRLIPTAVEEIHRGWEQHDKPEIGIVIFLEGFSEDEPFARGKQEHIPYDMYREHTEKLHSRDCCDIYRAEAFLAYPFPVFPGECFLSETVLWNQMAPKYRIVYINKVIYLAEYLEDGLTKAGRKMRIRVPRGGMYAANQLTDKHYPIRLRLKNGLLYNCYGFFAGASLRELRQQSLSKAVMYMTRPGGWMLYQHWEKKYGREE